MTVRFYDQVKQEIWATVCALNDAWTKGNPDDLAKYFHRDMVALTATDRLRRKGWAECISGWKCFDIHRLKEIDAVIHVYGNSAVNRNTPNEQKSLS